MTAISQVLWGIALAAGACVFHVGMLAACVPRLSRLGESFHPRQEWLRNSAMLAYVVGTVMLSHILQVLALVFIILWVGALPDLNSAIYFGIVTYTSLGYGDIVLGEGLRILIGMASFTGLLTFGVSTAFFIGVISRMLPSVFGK